MTAKTTDQKLRLITTGGSPTAILPGFQTRERNALAHRVAGRLELVCQDHWYVGVAAYDGRVWLESPLDDADDMGARLTALRDACAAEGLS